jgi:predicted HAD superfamily Cof-like phosphohydrolase
MKNKNQSFEQIERTIEWNTMRGNTPSTLDYQLEISMLQEELDEFILAVEQDDKVAMFDALLDLDFVRIGTLGKMGIGAHAQVDGYEAVLEANESKSSTKNSSGKITKPKDFVGPEPELQKILDERVNNVQN